MLTMLFPDLPLPWNPWKLNIKGKQSPNTHFFCIQLKAKVCFFFILHTPGRCAILVVSHGDPLQMLQNVFHSAKLQEGDGLAERFQMSRVASVLSQHRKFALLTGELRPLI